jgi:L-threonylcarbamoyladenylate synthase
MIVDPTEQSLARAAEIIRNGGLVAFPTETVYGLGANALDPEAVKRIYEIKGRPLASPLIVHVADEAMGRAIAADWPKLAQRLAARFCPGPLTIIVKKAAIVPDLVTAGLDSVGIRMPAHPIARTLIDRAGVPIAAPSANRFTEVSPTRAEHVQAAFGDSVQIILDGGACEVGIESTVVSLRRDPPVVLRPGIISREELESATGTQWGREIALPYISESPGLYPRHYAPRTRFYVLEPGIAKPTGKGRLLEMPSDSRQYAAQLYAELRKADSEGWDWIAVEKPPETPEWEGILDRLTRASATPL